MININKWDYYIVFLTIKDPIQRHLKKHIPYNNNSIIHLCISKEM